MSKSNMLRHPHTLAERKATLSLCADARQAKETGEDNNLVRFRNRTGLPDEREIVRNNRKCRNWKNFRQTHNRS